MRASELEGKEVIDIHTGDRLGVIQKTELLINTVTGTVEGLIMVKRGFGAGRKSSGPFPGEKSRRSAMS